MLVNILRFLPFLYGISLCLARIHQLDVDHDGRKYIALSTFGFYRGGNLTVQLSNFTTHPEDDSAMFGFSLHRTMNDAINPYWDTHPQRCILQEPLITSDSASTFGHKPSESNSNTPMIYFIMDLKQRKLRVKCGQQLIVHISKVKNQFPMQPVVPLRSSNRRRHLNASGGGDVEEGDACEQLHFDMEAKTLNGHTTYYNTSFTVFVATDAEEGLYNLYFHNCANYLNGASTTMDASTGSRTQITVDFTIDLFEHNISSFLSAGEMPLPALYSMLACLFLLSGMFWVFLLRQSKHPVYKIHHMMAVLVFLKALSLVFHGVNYHYIEHLGVHLATWAVLFYVAHLLKGALLFVVLILVGTGWTFIKHVLAPREKRLFMAIIPLQVFANVVEIILEESEEGAREYLLWRNVFTLVDLLCCGCILFPVVWSIRHLQEAAHTDGKAAINLRKLKLFRHFYVMIVCYIYSTRIIVYLLRLTLPFRYGWIDEMFREMATYVFFVLTAYKFRPAAQNPYFSVEYDDDDEEVDIVLTETGVMQGVNRVNTRTAKTLSQSTIVEVSEEEKDTLLGQQSESSHEYD